MQYNTEIFKVVELKKKKKSVEKKNMFFLLFAQHTDCGYTLEPPHRSGSNEYQQSLFCSKKKNNEK